MKHQDQRIWFRGIKRMLLTLLCLGAFAGTTQAQTVLSNLIWEQGAPAQNPTPIVALGDSGYLYINAKLYAKNIVNPKIEVVLPVGIDFVRVGSTAAPGNAKQTIYTDANLTPAASFDNGTVTGTSVAGTRKFTINYTANSKTLRIGDSIVMKIAIRATCGVDIFNQGDYVIDISGNDFVLGGHRDYQASVQKPTMRLQPTSGYEIINYTQVKDTNLVSLDIDAQNGYVKSFRAMFTYNPQIIYVDSFKIDGVLIPAARIVYNPVTVTTQTSRTVTITLTQAELNGNVNNIARKLTFRATSNQGCNQFINTEIWYDASYTNTNAANQCGNRWTGSQVILQLPSEGVAPIFSYSSATTRVQDDDDFDNMRNKNDWRYVKFDGSLNWAKATFSNSNSAPTSSFRILSWLTTSLSPCAYIDSTQIYFRVSVRNAANTADSIVIDRTRITAKYLTGNTGNPYYPMNVSSGRFTNAQMYSSGLLNKFVGYYINLPISMDNQLPVGAKVEILMGFAINPDWINEAYQSKSNYQTYYNDYNYNLFRIVDEIWTSNACGATWSNTSDIYPGANYSTRKPQFNSAGQSEVYVYPNTIATISNRFRTASDNNLTNTNPADEPTGPRYTEIFVKLPVWCSLDMSGGTIESAFDLGGRVFTDGQARGGNVYSAKFWNTADVIDALNIRIKPGVCLSGDIISDTIQIWADWHSGDTGINPARKTFKKTTKIFSILKLNCQNQALIVDEFGVHRQNRGFKDSNNDHIPDDGTLALDSEIDHNKLLEGDTAYYYVKGRVGGTAGNVYDRLVTILKYTMGTGFGAQVQARFGNTQYTQPFWNQATIIFTKQADGSVDTFALSIPTVNNIDSLIVYYDGVANDYLAHGGDSVYLKIPFVVKQIPYSYVRRSAIGIKTYGIKDDSPVWVDMYAKDDDIFKITFFELSQYNNPSTNSGAMRDQWTSIPQTALFTNACSTQDVLYHYVYVRDFGLDCETPTFNKEVRYQQIPKQARVTIPAGFEVTNNATFKLRFMKWGFTWASAADDILVQADNVVEDFTTHNKTYYFDLSRYIDYDYNGSNATVNNISVSGKLSNGKYFMGDDAQGIHLLYNLRATPAISTGNQVYTVYSFQNQAYANIDKNSVACYLTYNGPRLYLESSPQIVYTNSQQLSLASVKIQNSHGTLTNRNVWLYLKGNVENAVLTDGTTTINGQGLDNNWLYVGNMTPMQMKNYRLVFDYKGKNECGANDTITLYTALDAVAQNGSWNPNTAYPIDSVNACNRGAYTYTILDSQSPKTKIAGYVTANVPNIIKPGALHYNGAYTVDYVINGRVSQGALNDPYVTVRVPMGQVYVDTTALFGLASFEYPVGSGFRPIPAAIRTAMAAAIGSGSNETQIREFAIYAKDLLDSTVFMLPGWGADPSFGFTDLDRELSIRIPFVPTCETDLTGIRYRGAFYGKNSCGLPCEDNGTQYITPTIYTDVTPEYSFQVNLQNINMDARVYSPDRTKDTLIATFKKDLGVFTHLIKDGDYVRLRVPKQIVINGSIVSPQFGVISITGNPAGVVTADGDRIYELDFPVDQLNDSLPYRTDSITFTYRIPVLYTPDADDDCSAPRYELECQVITNANFSPDDCSDRPISLGSGRVLILTVTWEGSSHLACLGMPTPLTIACGSVTPVWYRDEVGTGGELGHTNTFVYTPQLQRDTVFYVRAVYDYGGAFEENFGITPLVVKMFPRVKPNFSALAVCEGTETNFIYKSGANASKVGTANVSSANT
ncbi:MAG: hypothetical protein LBN27_05535, partial [Prevotellaceae bacterium]|nr:hypothetical protein [Prevotellaceae bacterium]